MIVTHRYSMDLLDPGAVPVMELMQGDLCSRQIFLKLFSGPDRWYIPDDSHFLILFQRDDGTGGQYDTLPDGSAAIEWEEDYISVMVAPQVTASAGTVKLAVRLINAAQVLHTLLLELHVLPVPDAHADKTNYGNVTGFVPQPSGRCQSGTVLMVTRVNAQGKILEVAATEAANTHLVNAVLEALPTWNGGDY